jgi:hypothetical protein
MAWKRLHDDRPFPAWLVIGYAVIIAVAVTTPREVFTDPVAATATLERAGYSSIVMRGYSPWGCKREDEQWRSAFEARSPQDASVSGVVCQSTTRRGTIMIETTDDQTATPITEDAPMVARDAAAAAQGAVQ